MHLDQLQFNARMAQHMGHDTTWGKEHSPDRIIHLDQLTSQPTHLHERYT